MEETVLFKRKGEGERFERGKVKYIVKFKNDKMLAIIAELDEGAETDEYRHEGEEFRIVINGEIECTVANKSYKMKAGDSIWHRSDLPHKIKNIGKGKAVYLTIGIPPTFV